MMHNNAAMAPTIAPAWWVLRFALVLFPVLVGGTLPDAVEGPIVVDVDELVDTPAVVALK